MSANTLDYFAKHKDVIDMDSLSQIFEMDDDGDTEFSSAVIHDWLEETEKQLKMVDSLLQEEDLNDVETIIHGLCGSSATLGIRKLNATCQKIKNVARGKNEDGTEQEPHHMFLGRKDVILRISPMAVQARKDYEEASLVFRGFYGE